MKKLYILPVIVSLLSVVSCNNNSKESLSTNNYLTLKSINKNEYQQYSSFDFSSIVVEQTINNKTSVIKDYVLKDTSSNSIISSKTKLNNIGPRNIEISKEGFSSANFSITVLRVTSFTQSISITKLPSVDEYNINDTLDLSGLSVSLFTSYISRDGKAISRKNTLDSEDYQIYVNDTLISDPTSFTLTKLGSYKVEVRYLSWNQEDELISDFYVYANNDKSEIKLNSYSYESDKQRDLDSTKMTVTISNPNVKEDSSSKGYYTPSEVEVPFTIKNFGESSYEGWDYTPSKGKVPLLVVPIVLPNYDNLATKDNWDLINKVFFGDSSDLNYESLHSYYYKSSYGQLDFTGTVTDYYVLDKDSLRFKDGLSSTSDTQLLAQEAANWAQKRYDLNLKDYDSDNNGTIDAMWMVYIAPSSKGDNLYWAFTDTTGKKPSSENDVVANIYGWCGIDFLQGKAYSSTTNPDSNGDGHVVIHETGHMLGLADYYSYSGSGYSPLGSCDMMDNNVGDQNPYSKMLLGWSKPYVIDNTKKEVTITLNSSQVNDNIIVIPYDNKKYTYQDGKLLFNPFDEYMVLDYYSYKNLNVGTYETLNAQMPQALKDKDGNYIKGYERNDGGRLYHVDNRLTYQQEASNKYGFKFTIFDNPDDILNTSSKYTLYRAISNSEAGSRSENIIPGLENVKNANAFDEIRWVGRDLRPFYAQGWQQIEKGHRPTSASLFRQGDTITLLENTDTDKKIFNVSKHFLPALVNENNESIGNDKFDNGQDYSYSIHIDKIA